MLTEYNPASHLIYDLFYVMMAVIGFMVAVDVSEYLYGAVKQWLGLLRREPWALEEAAFHREDNPTTYRVEKPEGAARRHFFHRFRMRNFSWSKPGTRLVGGAPPQARPRIGGNR